MTPPGDEPIRMRLAEIEPGRSFTDETEAGDFAVRTEHRLEPAAGGLTRIVYRTEITGEAAGAIGPQLGPQITADFPAGPAPPAEPAEGCPGPLAPEESPGLLLADRQLPWP